MMQAKAGEPAAANARARQGGRTYGLAPVLPGLALAGVDLEGRRVRRVRQEHALRYVARVAEFCLSRQIDSLDEEGILLFWTGRNLLRGVVRPHTEGTDTRLQTNTQSWAGLRRHLVLQLVEVDCLQRKKITGRSAPGVRPPVSH